MIAWRSGFYGYFIALFTFLALLFLGGSYYGLSVIVPIMAKEMDWSATQFGGVFSTFSITLGIFSPVVGILVVRFGPQLAMIGGSIAGSAALGLMSTTSELWQLYAFTVILGVAIASGLAMAPQQVVSNWFLRKRALMLGLVIAGSAIGGLIAAPMSYSLIDLLGSWRASWLALSGFALVAALVALLFIKSNPRDLGQTVDGLSQQSTSDAESTTQVYVSRVHTSEHSWSVGDAIRTRAFWLVLLAGSAFFWSIQTTVAHQMAFLSGEGGVEPGVAAGALGLTIGFSVFGKVTAGWLSDRVEPRKIMGSSLMLQSLSIVILLTWHGMVPLYIYVALFGISFGGALVPQPAILVNYFGVRNFAAILGIMNLIATIAGTSSPLVSGAIKDLGGSYVPAFALMAVLTLGGCICAFVARPPVHRSTAITRVVEEIA